MSMTSSPSPSSSAILEWLELPTILTCTLPVHSFCRKADISGLIVWSAALRVLSTPNWGHPQ
jgi:hypothetical protein